MARAYNASIFVLIVALGFITVSTVVAAPYDYLMLTQSWYGTTCRVKNCRYLTSKNTEDFRHFNIHGLWPQKETGVLREFLPADCAEDGLAFEDYPTDLRQSLEVFWSGSYNPTRGFLEHEWTKHGTCWEEDVANSDEVVITDSTYTEVNTTEATYTSFEETSIVATNLRGGKLERSQTAPNPSRGRGRPQKPKKKKFPKGDAKKQEAYFRTVLKLAKEFNPFDILAKSDIMPSFETQYTVKQLQQAITAATGVKNFVMRCMTIEKEKYLEDIRLCLDKHYQPMDCPPSRMGANSCPERFMINYVPIEF